MNGFKLLTYFGIIATILYGIYFFGGYSLNLLRNNLLATSQLIEKPWESLPQPSKPTEFINLINELRGSPTTNALLPTNLEHMDNGNNNANESSLNKLLNKLIKLYSSNSQTDSTVNPITLSDPQITNAANLFSQPAANEQ